jgi:hypothetical protein
MSQICRTTSRLLAAAVILFVTHAAHAQLGIYGTLNATKVINPVSTQSNIQNAINTGYWSTGGEVGVYYDFWRIGPISVGSDLRVSGASQAKLGLFGARVALHPTPLPFKPYVEGLVGVANSTNAYNLSSTDLAWEIAGGVDYSLIPHIDLRVLEFGGGQISTSATTTPTPTRSLYTISTGFAIHF